MTDHELPLLDLEVVEDLEQALGAGFTAAAEEAAIVFLATARECSQLAAAAEWDALRAVAHRLKGGAGTIGATQLLAVARDLEVAAIRRDPAYVWQQLDEMLAVMAATNAALRQRYAPATSRE